MKRDNLLTLSWTGAPLVHNGRELVLSYGRFELLKSWGNELLSDADTDQSRSHAMGEIALVCCSTKDEIKELNRMTADDRKAAVTEWMIDNEEATGDLFEGIEIRIAAIKAATVESETPGKEDARHAP
jgi:hypothetical protein